MDVQDHGDGVVSLAVTRVADGNHISSAQLRELARRLDDVASRADLRAVVLFGEGDDFCAGRVGEPGLVSPAEIRDDLELILDVNRRLRTSPVPYVAAVEGRAVGFGCGFATQCDVTIAGEGAWFALPEMSHKLPPLVVLSYFAKFVPYKKAFELALTSRRFTAREAAEIGIVTQVVPSGTALARALDYARMIAGLDAQSVRLMRSFARRVSRLHDDRDAQDGIALMAIALSARALADPSRATRNAGAGRP